MYWFLLIRNGGDRRICDQLSHAALYPASFWCDGTISTRGIRDWRHSSAFFDAGWCTRLSEKRIFTSLADFIYGKQYIGGQLIRQLCITFYAGERDEPRLWITRHCGGYSHADSEKGQRADAEGEVTFHKGLASAIAFVIGSVSGVLGAGGAFILVPVMLSILKIPVRMTIASSLAITFLSAIGASTGKVLTGQVMLLPAVVLMAASLVAAPIGAKVGQKINAVYLQWALAVMITATAVKIWLDIL